MGERLLTVRTREQVTFDVCRLKRFDRMARQRATASPGRLDQDKSGACVVGAWATKAMCEVC